ncbi:MAG: SUF system NifU family Fe-S cluster assembly protein [Deltaproteobacteria bacterium]|nr:SUF system NifU family Fe-S cluster assembly protein [Deltaproteobacteria bacterium]
MMDDLRELYQEVILDHGRNPRNCRHPDDHSHAAEGDNPMCGDRLSVYLKIDDDGTIRDVAFEGRGCAISIASASIMTEMLPGLKEADARHLFDCFHQLVTGQEINGDAGDLDKLVVMSGVRNFPVRIKCATLAWHAMTAAMDGRSTATTE